MAHDDQARPEILESHPDGTEAVRVVQALDSLFYAASDPQGLGVGVYDDRDHARSAANWARDFLIERPDLSRLALMQLIVDKLTLQYPDDTAEAVLGPTGE